MSRWKTVVSNRLGVPCARIMGTLADETRLRVVEVLLSGARNVSDLNAAIGIEATLLSHHLRVLREAGLVDVKRDGRFLTYSVSARIISARRESELDFGCCTFRFSGRPAGKSNERIPA